MKDKIRKIVLVILWLMFIGLAGGILYLSFQSGSAAKMIDQQVLSHLSPDAIEDGTTTADHFFFLVRQFGRAGAFLLLGMLGTLTIYLSWPTCNCLIKYGISAVILLGMAALTERLKIYIPTRHYSYEEMMISITAVSVGFLLVVMITFILRAIKGIKRLSEAKDNL